MVYIITFIGVLVISFFIWIYTGKREKEVIVAIVIGSATIGGAVISTAISNQETKIREINESHRLHKIEVYTEFSDLIVKVLNSVNSIPKNSTDDEKIRIQNELVTTITKDYFLLSKKLLLWGSPEVLKKYQKFREISAQNNNTSELHSLLYIDDVYAEMRSDLGLSNAGLKRGDLFKLFLSDPEELDKILN